MSEETTMEVLAAKNSEVRRNNFIEAHKHFILATAYKTAGHYITESDDEYSVSLIAFNEAIDSYERSKGEFYSFAALVIRRRLYDYIRSESRFAGEIAIEPSVLSGGTEEDSPSMPLQMELRQREAELSERNTADRPGGSPVKDEIEAVQALLGKYGFSFFDLTECSPKAGKTKNACAQAVAFLLQHKDLIYRMQQTCSLPAGEILKSTKISRKILERHRRYIIAAVEILNGEYPLLAEYMSYIRKALVT